MVTMLAAMRPVRSLTDGRRPMRAIAGRSEADSGVEQDPRGQPAVVVVGQRGQGLGEFQPSADLVAQLDAHAEPGGGQGRASGYAAAPVPHPRAVVEGVRLARFDEETAEAQIVAQLERAAETVIALQHARIIAAPDAVAAEGGLLAGEERSEGIFPDRAERKVER